MPIVIGSLERAPFTFVPSLEGHLYHHPDSPEGTWARVFDLAELPSILGHRVFQSSSGRTYVLLSVSETDDSDSGS